MRKVLFVAPLLLASVVTSLLIVRPARTTTPRQPQPTKPAAVDFSACDTACIIKEAQSIARNDSPTAALEWISTIDDDGTKFTCHSVHHAVGVDVGRRSYPDFPRFETTDCQYGYLHGTLQGVATELSYDGSTAYGENSLEKMLYWLEKGSAFCLSLDKSAPASPSNVREATPDCLHALGHGAAVIEYDDLGSVLEACSSLEDLAFICADGAMMEYADDIWDRAGWVHWETGYTDIKTSFDPAETESLCLNVDPSVAKACWLRIGSFVGPLAAGDPVRTGAACLASPIPEYKDGCLFSAASIAVENAHRESPVNWPPENDRDAQAWVRSGVVECRRWPDFEICLKGFITPTTSHLYTANLGDLVARACDAEKGTVREICLEALSQAEHDK